VDENTLVRQALVFSRLQVEGGLPALVVIGGPLTIAATLCPLELLCGWIKQRPVLVHEILQLTAGLIVDIVRCWVADFGVARVIPKIHEPLASNDIISPEQFVAFVLPPLKALSESILSMGVSHLFYHICGNQNQNLCHWSKVPMGSPGVVSVGHRIDLQRALECFQDSNIVAGSLDPRVLSQGPVGLLRQAVRACLDVGRCAARGFMLAPGCEVASSTPPYHMWVLSQSARS
jgi:uroporphyrinogen decarboxylase